MDFQLYHLHKKKYQYDWVIPSMDKDLLDSKETIDSLLYQLKLRSPESNCEPPNPGLKLDRSRASEAGHAVFPPLP